MNSNFKFVKRFTFDLREPSYPQLYKMVAIKSKCLYIFKRRYWEGLTNGHLCQNIRILG